MAIERRRRQFGFTGHVGERRRTVLPEQTHSTGARQHEIGFEVVIEIDRQDTVFRWRHYESFHRETEKLRRSQDELHEQIAVAMTGAPVPLNEIAPIQCTCSRRCLLSGSGLNVN